MAGFYYTTLVDLVAKDSMPALTTSTATTGSTTSTADSTTTGSTSGSTDSSGSTSTASALTSSMPGVTSSSSSSGMPGISSTTTSTSTSSADYTTPSVGVPSNTNNPYIYRAKQPLGTVFIAVGSVVAVILVAFAIFHLVRSLAASSLAKKTTNNEKYAYEKYAKNNNAAYGSQITPLSSAFFDTAYRGSMASLPLLKDGQSAFGGSVTGGDSTLAGSEVASNNDLTNMFISPTREVMGGRRVRQATTGSAANVSLVGKGLSVTALPAANRHSQPVPHLYLNDDFTNSDYSVQQSAARSPERKPRRAVPSMYLDDLIDN